MFTADTLLTEACFNILFTETKLKVDDLGNLKRFLQNVTPYWVLIADQLGMTLQVANIRDTVANKGPSDYMRDLLLRWLSREHPCPTLEFLCQALRSDSDIIGGGNAATKLEEEFQSHTGLQMEVRKVSLCVHLYFLGYVMDIVSFPGTPKEIREKHLVSTVRACTSSSVTFTI